MNPVSQLIFSLFVYLTCSGGDPHYVASLAVTAKQSSFLSLSSFGMAGMHRHVRLNFIIVMSGILLFNEYMLNIKLNIMDAKHVHIKNIIDIYIY